MKWLKITFSLISLMFFGCGGGGSNDAFLVSPQVKADTASSSSIASSANTASSSNILVVSPHPDDDILTAAGVTYAATQRGEQVTIVYITNGDVGGSVAGNSRQDEAVDAQINHLGTKESDLIFLGYPDGGLSTMYLNYPNQSDQFLSAPSGQTATYGHRGLGGTDYHNYRFGAHANYNRYNLVNDLADIINTQRPKHIITTAEFDQHADHATTYSAVRDAVLAVTAADPSYVPVIHKSLVHFAEVIWPSSGDSLSYYSEPPGLVGTGVVWNARESLDVPILMQLAGIENLKYLAIMSHASQGGANGYLGKFSNKDEFFWPLTLNGTNAPPRVDAGVDQTVMQGATVILNGSSSSDPKGTGLAYHWRQINGPAVILANATNANPSFTAPAGSPTNIMLTFELIVDDGILNTLPDHVSVRVLSPTSVTNIALLATVTASSQNIGTNQQAIRVIDGVVDGWPGDYTREWATVGEGAGAWIQLNWSSAYTVSRVVLHDRPNLNEQITSATLTFSDGSIVPVCALSNKGTGVEFNVGPFITNSLRLTITSVSGSTQNIGLSEFEVYGSPTSSTGTNIAPQAMVTASSQSAGTNQQAAKAVDGVIDGWPGDYTREWASVGEGAGAWLQLNWSTAYTVSRVVLHDRPNPNDQIISATLTFSDGSTVQVGTLDNAGTGAVFDVGPLITSSLRITITSVSGSTQNIGLSELEVYGSPTSSTATNIAPQATVTASSQSAGTNQQAVKAIDGIADGYPSNYTREWASVGEGTGAWLQLNWSSAYTVNRVVLHDRPNPNDQITSATLTFSDGSTVMVGTLDNAGTGVVINVGPFITNSLRITITSVSGNTQNIGLSELEVYGSPPPSL